MKKINLIITLVMVTIIAFAQSFVPVQHGVNVLNDLVSPGVSSVCLDEPTPPVLAFSTTPNNTTLPDFAYIIETPTGLVVHESGNLNLSSNGTLGWMNPGDKFCVSGVAYDLAALNATAYGIAQVHTLGSTTSGCALIGIDPISCDATYLLYAGADGIIGNADDNTNAITNFEGALAFTANLDVPPSTSTSNLRAILNTVNGLAGGIEFSLSNGGYGNDYCITVGALCNPVMQCGETLGTLSNSLGVTSFCQDEATPPTLIPNAADNTSTLPDFAYLVEANGALIAVEGSALDLFSSNLNFVQAGQQVCVSGVAFDVASVNAAAYGLAQVHTLGSTTSGCALIGIAPTSCDAIFTLYAGADGIIGNADDNTSPLNTFEDALRFLQNLDVPPPTNLDNLIYGLNIVNQLVGSICFAVTNAGFGNDYCVDVTGPCNPIAQCGQTLGSLTAPSPTTTLICRDGSNAPVLNFSPATDNTSTLPNFAYLITSSDGTVSAIEAADAPLGTFDLSPGATIGYLNPGDNFCVSGIAYDIVTINNTAYGLAQVHTLGSTTSGCAAIGIAPESCDAIFSIYAGADGIVGNMDDNINAISNFEEALDFTSQLAVPTPNNLGNVIVALNTINGLAGTLCFALTNGGTGADYCYTITNCNPSINNCAVTSNLPALTCVGSGTLNPDGSNAPTITYSNPIDANLPDYAIIIESPTGLTVLESGSATLNPAGFGAVAGQDICVSGVAYSLAALNPVVTGLAATHTIGSTTSGCVNLGIAPTSCDNIFNLVAGADGTIGTADDGSISNFQEALDFTNQLDIYPSTSFENLILGLNTINGLVGSLCFAATNNGVGNDCCYTVDAGCIPVLNITGNVATNVYQADDVITSNGSVSAAASGGAVTYQAGAVNLVEYVELTSGFNAAGNVNFTAINIDCDDSDN